MEKHAAGANVPRIKVVQEHTGQAIVGILQLAAANGLQPTQRLRRREANACLPRLIRGHAQVAVHTTVFDPSLQSRRERRHGLAVPQRIEYAVDESLMTAATLRIAQQRFVSRSHVGRGEWPERMVGPGLIAKPGVLFGRIAQRAQNFHPLRDGQRCGVGIEHEAQRVARDQQIAPRHVMHRQPRPQAAQWLHRPAIEALHQGQHAAQWQALGDALRQCLGGQELGDAAVPRRGDVCLRAEDLAAQRGSLVMQLQREWQLFQSQVVLRGSASQGNAPPAAQQLHSEKQAGVVQQPRDTACLHGPECLVLLIDFARQLPARGFVDGGACLRPFIARGGFDDEIEQQRIAQQVVQASALGALQELLDVGHLSRAACENGFDLVALKRIQMQHFNLAVRRHLLQMALVVRAQPIGLPARQAKARAAMVEQPFADGIEGRSSICCACAHLVQAVDEDDPVVNIRRRDTTDDVARAERHTIDGLALVLERP